MMRSEPLQVRVGWGVNRQPEVSGFALNPPAIKNHSFGICDFVAFYLLAICLGSVKITPSVTL